MKLPWKVTYQIELDTSGACMADLDYHTCVSEGYQVPGCNGVTEGNRPKGLVPQFRNLLISGIVQRDVFLFAYPKLPFRKNLWRGMVWHETSSFDSIVGVLCWSG